MTTPLTDTDWNKALHPDRWWAREAALARRDGEIDRTHRRWRKWGRWITESDIDYLRRLIDDDIDYPLWLCPTDRRRHPQSPGQNPEGLPVQHPAWEGLPKCDRPVLFGCDQPDLFKCHCHRAPDLDGLVGLGASWR